MDCNAPINIIKKTADKCSLKCLLWYKYGTSSCTVQNKSDQLVIPYDGESDVMFNSVTYNPVEIRIFKPSIHKFEGQYADAEIVVVHNGNGGGLLVCIPVMGTSSANASTGTNLINDIVNNSPEANQSTTLNLHDFNLNYILPKSSYFSYLGTLAFNCSPGTMYNYVVFPKGSFIVNQSTLTSLGNLIHDSYINVVDGTCYWNEQGTKNNGFSGDGQIYIDCQPTGEEGEIIYQEQVRTPSIKNLEWLYALVYVIVGIFIMYACVGLMKYVLIFLNVVKSQDKSSG
jgi:carbonic anhydrase